jgi:hypothetical protein
MCKVFSLFVGICVIAAFGQPSQATLIGHWTFDEVSGSTALDSSGNGYNGVINGTATRVTGPLGTALSFNGTDNRVQITGTNSAGHALALAGDPSYTIAWWLNYTSGTRFVNKNDPFANTFGYSARASTTMAFTLGQNVVTTISLDAGNWHHWAVTVDMSLPGGVGSQRAKVYRDGILGYSFDPLANLSEDASSPLLFGAYFRVSNSTYGQYLTGLMDDIRIYNNTLTAGDISAIMSVPEPGTLSMLVVGLSLLAVRRQASRSARGACGR